MTSQVTSKIVEIVTFTLNAGVSDADYLALNAPSHDYIGALDGFVSRALSKAEDGTWTDYTIWDTLAAAQSAADGFMAQDFAPAMLGAINKEDFTMRHHEILWSSS